MILPIENRRNQYSVGGRLQHKSPQKGDKRNDFSALYLENEILRLD